MDIGKNYYVPDVRLYPELVQYVGKIYDKFTTTETDTLVVAQLLGHKSLSGAFNTKAGLMSTYSLIERRAGKIRVTELGRKIVFPSDPREKLEGARDAILKIPLWQRLYQEFTSKGAELPGNFWADLARIGELSPEEAKNKSDWVVRAYNADISFLRAIEKEALTIQSSPSSAVTSKMPESNKFGSSSNLPPASPVQSMSAMSGQIMFVSPDDRIQLSVPRSARHIGMLKSFVEDALKVIEEELVAEAKLVTDRERQRKSEADSQNVS